LISWLTSPEIAGEWSRFTGYFVPRKAAYDLPEMKEYLQQRPDAKVALNQLEYAFPWFDTYYTVAVRKAIEDQVQAILSGKTAPAPMLYRQPRRRPMSYCAPMLMRRPRNGWLDARVTPATEFRGIRKGRRTRWPISG
jgi:hypothetical protein